MFSAYPRITVCTWWVIIQNLTSCHRWMVSTSAAHAVFFRPEDYILILLFASLQNILLCIICHFPPNISLSGVQLELQTRLFLWTWLRIGNQGLPWWRGGWESACQCRGHGFEPWSGKIPHAAEQLGPWATTTEPARLEPVPQKRGRDNERLAHRNEEWPPLAATRGSPRTETKTQHSQK